jgi:hypothetical protein
MNPFAEHVLRPWEREGCHGVVSLYDMLRFAAENFWRAAETLTEMRNRPQIAKSPFMARQMKEALDGLMINLRALDLPVSVKEFQKFNIWMNHFVQELAAISDKDKQKEAFLKSESVVGTKLEQLASIVESELSSSLFVHVPREGAAYFDQKELLGTAVIDKFPMIQYDMVEAGNCYALGRSTACVFHLMRIMEVGVQQFGNKLGVTLTEAKNWQNILDEVNKAIKALPTKDPATVAMSQASANLYAVKLAWRNEVMHPNDTYTLEEAEDILRQVKLSMQQLVEIV